MLRLSWVKEYWQETLASRVQKQGSLESTKGELSVVFLCTLPQLLPFVGLVAAYYIFLKPGQRIGDRWAKTMAVLDQGDTQKSL